MTNYIAPGVSFDKYLKAFFSQLKNEGISNEDYVGCQEVWRDNGMTTLRDFLVWYNNRDVVPFLQAIDRQFAFYQQRGIDMFKQGISVPGLTLLYLFNDLPEKTRRIKIFIISSKITWLVDLRLLFTAITRKESPRYVRTCTERPLVRVDRSSATNDSHGKPQERDAPCDIKSTVERRGSVNFRWTGGAARRTRRISSTDVYTTVTRAWV